MIAHLRRVTPSITATPDGDGWRLSGVADWCTGWGLIDVVLVGALAPGGRHLLALVPALSEADGGPAGLGSSGPAGTAMRGAHTSRLFFTQASVPADAVLDVTNRDAWLADDRLRRAAATPASLGVLRRAVAAFDRSRATSGRRADSERCGSSHQGRHGAADAGVRALGLGRLDGRDIRRESAVRGALAELGVRTTAALIAARGGAALSDDDPAARWVREALFHLVQAQTGDVRAVTLKRMTSRRSDT